MIQYGNSALPAVIRRSRSYQILSELRRDWESLLRNIDVEEEEHHAKYQKWMVDLPAAIRLLLQYKNLRRVGRRNHRAFPKFKYDMNFVENISAYREKLQDLALKLDAAQQYRSETRLSSQRINE